MNNAIHNPEPHASLAHLPFYSALQEYDASNWVSFGTLTHRYPTSAATQLARFKELMNTMGMLNGSYGKRLHWVVRVEGGHLDNTVHANDDTKRTHLHFVLAAHKVTDARRHSMTVADACRFLESNWNHGRAEVTPYDSARDGLGYILKCTNGPASDEWNDTVEISTSLMTVLKEKKVAEPYADRDPLALEILLGLRRHGATAWFGDEVPRWRAA